MAEFNGNDIDGSGSWNAQRYLKSNMARKTSEETPLLGNGATSRRPMQDDISSTGYADYADTARWRKPSIFWLIGPFFLLALSFGGILVPKLNLILSLMCKSYLADRSKSDPAYCFTPVLLDADNPQCRIPEVQELATQFMLYVTVISGLMSAIMAPRLGAWSDRYGRTRFLALSSVGLFLSEIITILAAKYPDKISYQWLLAGAVLDGLFGSFTSGMAITFAYASDCTSPAKRAVTFSYFHAGIFSGIAIGPLVVAFVIDIFGDLLSIFYFALGVHAFYILFILFVVPESLTKKRQMIARESFAASNEINLTDGRTWLRFFIKGNLFAPLEILWPTGPGSSPRLRANLILLATVDTLIFGIAMGSLTVIVYYLGYEFGWDSKQTSIFMSIVSTSRVTALLLVLPILTYLFRTRRQPQSPTTTRNTGSDSFELNMVRLAILFEIIGYAGYALARTGSLFILFGIFAALGGIGSPTLEGALTKHVPPERVGQLLGATGLLHALARVVAPTISNLIYSKTVKMFPQTIFVVLSVCFGVAFVCSLFTKPNVYLDKTPTRPQTACSRAAVDAEVDVRVDEDVAATV